MENFPRQSWHFISKLQEPLEPHIKHVFVASVIFSNSKHPFSTYDMHSTFVQTEQKDMKLLRSETRVPVFDPEDRNLCLVAISQFDRLFHITAKSLLPENKSTDFF